MKIAHHQLGRSYGYVMPIIAYAEIIMANINSLTARQAGDAGANSVAIHWCQLWLCNVHIT